MAAPCAAPKADDRKAGRSKSVGRRIPRPPFDAGSVHCCQASSSSFPFSSPFLTIVVLLKKIKLKN